MSGRLNVAFVGSVVTDREALSNAACSVAGNLFQKNFIGAIAAAKSWQVDILSYEPAQMYPRGHRLFYFGGVRSVDRAATAKFFGFINLPIIKQITQFVTLLAALSRWHRRHRTAADRTVILFNVFAPHSLAVRIARAFFGGRAIALIADMPHGLYEFSGFWGVLQRLDFVIQTRSIRHFDGLIVLTKMIASDFAPAVPAMVLEGAVADDAGGSGAAQAPAARDPYVLLFTGGLKEVNGIELLLETFSRVRGSDYRLRIFGRGPLEPLVLEASRRDSRIEFCGFASNETVMREQARATVLLNLRPTNHPITRYTFPSKLMEYMLSGRPVLTTRLAGIPADYEPHLFILDDETPEGLANAIHEICESPGEGLTRVGASAREFVRIRKNWSEQGRRVEEFVRSLTREPEQ